MQYQAIGKEGIQPKALGYSCRGSRYIDLQSTCKGRSELTILCNSHRAIYVCFAICGTEKLSGSNVKDLKGIVFCVIGGESARNIKALAHEIVATFKTSSISGKYQESLGCSPPKTSSQN